MYLAADEYVVEVNAEVRHVQTDVLDLWPLKMVVVVDKDSLVVGRVLNSA